MPTGCHGFYSRFQLSNYVDAIIKKTPDPSTQHLKFYALSCVNQDWIISFARILETYLNKSVHLNQLDS